MRYSKLTIRALGICLLLSICVPEQQSIFAATSQNIKARSLVAERATYGKNGTISEKRKSNKGKRSQTQPSKSHPAEINLTGEVEETGIIKPRTQRNSKQTTTKSSKNLSAASAASSNSVSIEGLPSTTNTSPVNGTTNNTSSITSKGPASSTSYNDSPAVEADSATSTSVRESVGTSGGNSSGSSGTTSGGTSSTDSSTSVQSSAQNSSSSSTTTIKSKTTEGEASETKSPDALTTELSNLQAKMHEKPSPARVTVPQTVLALPGELDNTPYFNCNSPEIVLEPGVLCSTFPKEHKAHPDAHLNHALNGRFDVFFHHVTNATKTPIGKVLYLGMLIGNASSSKVHVQVNDAVSYLTKPDAPFIVLDTVLDNEKGKIYAGPGDRVMLDLLRGHKQSGWHHSITLNPGEIKLVYSLPMPVKSLIHPLNGRTGVLKMDSDGPVYLASLSAFSEKKFFGGEKKPGLNKWKEVLESMPLVQPRDKTPTPPGAKGHLVYGRVAGVAKGSTWRATLSNDKANERLVIGPNKMISFPINTLRGGTLGTNQVQAAPMTVRYSDTAYHSNGNYGVLYDLNIPLFNESEEPITAGLSFETPLKDWNSKDSLQYFAQPPESIFFRGTISLEWADGNNKHNQKLVHLVEKRGQSVPPLIELTLAPHQNQELRFRCFYPADCTPPQVLTITTVVRKQENASSANNAL